MADTYGYDPSGNKQFDPSKYDQWGVYMGNRAAEIGAAPTGPMQNSSLWSSNAPFEEWVKQYAATQLARNSQGGLGVEVTAPQGTPEYRQQVAAREEAARLIAGWGGTVGNMGLHPAKGQGLNLWNQFKDNKPGQLADWARAKALGAYNSRAVMAARANTGGQGSASSGVPGESGFGTLGTSTFAPASTTAPTAATGATSTMSGGAVPGGPITTDAFGRPLKRTKLGLSGLLGG